MLETRTSARRATPLSPVSLAARTGECAAWRLSRILGNGRWTRIYQARPKSLPADGPADYALKVLRSEYEQQPVARAALQRESLVARQVTHPHLAPVLSAHLQATPYHLVLPYLEGATLRAALTSTGGERGLRPSNAIWIVRQIAEGLCALHAADWLHGDLKPENILLSPQGHATLLDLGLARRLGSEECRSWETLQGTPTYIAPEAFRTQGELSAASDLYSLGVVLFEALTGRQPWNTRSAAEVAAAHLRQTPLDVRALAPHVPLELARLVRQLLAKDPLRRPSAEELISRLVELEIETLGAT